MKFVLSETLQNKIEHYLGLKQFDDLINKVNFHLQDDDKCTKIIVPV